MVIESARGCQFLELSPSALAEIEPSVARRIIPAQNAMTA